MKGEELTLFCSFNHLIYYSDVNMLREDTKGREKIRTSDYIFLSFVMAVLTSN